MKRDAGVEPLVHFTCRDRNLIGLQSDILGVYAHGVRNMLCLSGDHQKFGDHPKSKGVFDLDSIQLVAMVKKMRAYRGFFSPWGNSPPCAPEAWVVASRL